MLSKSHALDTQTIRVRRYAFGFLLLKQEGMGVKFRFLLVHGFKFFCFLKVSANTESIIFKHSADGDIINCTCSLT